MAETTGSAPWNLADLMWERLSEAGVAALDEGRHEDADRAFAEAGKLAAGFAGNDPRRAAALNNAAVAAHIVDPSTDPGSALRRAVEAWAAAGAWIGTMALEPRSRSSLFHLRLEIKHRERYREISREDYRRLLAEGRAVSEANLAMLAGSGKAEGSSDGRLAAWDAGRPPHFCDLRKLAAAARLVARLG